MQYEIFSCFLVKNVYFAFAAVNFQSFGFTEAIAKMITSLNNRSHLKTEPVENGKETNNRKK